MAKRFYAMMTVFAEVDDGYDTKGWLGDIPDGAVVDVCRLNDLGYLESAGFNSGRIILDHLMRKQLQRDSG